MDRRSFGPVVYHEKDGSLRASCSWCTFRVHVTCTHVRPSRHIPDPKNTPDWCEMKSDMLRDVAAELAEKGGAA